MKTISIVFIKLIKAKEKIYEIVKCSCRIYFERSSNKRKNNIYLSIAAILDDSCPHYDLTCDIQPANKKFVLTDKEGNKLTLLAS